MDRNSSPNQREMVFCHECENEWYRDEHGLICPECQSDFTEIIEANHDPRMDDPRLAPVGPPTSFRENTREWYAPDPDEDDINEVEWPNRGSDRSPSHHLHGTFTRSPRPGSPQDGQSQGQPAGLLGVLGSMFGGIQQQQQQQQQQDQQTQQQEQRHWQHPQHPHMHQQSPPPWQFGGEGFRSMTASPGGTTTVRHTSGPNFSVTFTTTSNLHPRNAGSPQPFQHHPENLDHLFGQIFMNIGAFPDRGFRGGTRMGSPEGFVAMGGGGGPREFGGGGSPGGRGPPLDLFSLLFGGPPGGVHGDAVYSQDAFDRIITQLMEQHQAGNAPGPATEDAINSLPSKQISKSDQGDSGKAECSICMDEVPLGDSVTVLPCEHWFHKECIKVWLSEHDTCPHCRRGIMAKDEPNNASRARQPSQPPLHDMHSPEYQMPMPSSPTPQTPGAFPFPPSSPRSPNISSARSPSGSGSSMFSRMREAFGGGSSSSNNGGNSGTNQGSTDGSRQR